MKRSLLIFFFLASAQGSAQNITPEAETYTKSAGELQDGWNPYLGLNLGVVTTSQKDVASSQDGNSTTWNSKIEGRMTLIAGSNEWRNDLLASLTMSRSPLIADYFKSDDILRFASLYLWHLPGYENFGPFARVALDTRMLPSYDVRADEATYAIAAADSEGDPTLKTTDRLQLSDAFSPLVLKETAGAFYYPYRSDIIAVEALFGLGARQTYADGQYALADDAATPDLIEVGRLEDQQETGLDGKLSVFGQVTQRLSYKVETDLFVPFARSNESEEDKDKDSFEKRSWEVIGNASFKLAEWASLEYLHRLQRNYSLSEKVQRTNTLLFNLSYVFGASTDKACAC